MADDRVLLKVRLLRVLPLTLLFLFFLSSFASAELVVNLTFDDNLTDDSAGVQSWSINGGLSWTDDYDACKLGGCMNASPTSGDYLDSALGFSMNDGLTVAYWIYRGDTSSHAMYNFGSGDDVKWTEYSTYCFHTAWDAASGMADHNTASSGCFGSGEWHHVAHVYDESRLITYLDGSAYINSSEPYGTLNYSLSEALEVGRGRYGIDLHGYLDEFLVYNESLNTHDISALYESQRLGTPPQLDLIVKNVTVPDALSVMYDFSTVNNTLNTSGTVPLNYVIENTGGTNNSDSFNVTVYVGGLVVCHNTTSLNAGATESFVCQLNKTEGFMNGNITVDSNNDIDETAYIGGSEDNNVYLVHYDLRAHPKLVAPINISYVSDSSNGPAYEAYNWHKSFVSEDFDPSWDADDVDPRGKKGYENAVGCYLNAYNSATQCARAKNHLLGWLVNVSDWDSVDVQAAHELEWVAKTYDLMFNNLTEEEAETYSQGLQDACLSVYGMSNVRPDLDDDVISAGNGWGFGIGMAYPCLAVLGEVDNNPSSYLYLDDSTTGVSTPYNWLNRLDKHVMGTMNGSGFVEGVTYHLNYALYHTVGLLYYDQQTALFNIAQNRQGDICGRARSLLYYYLDNTYNGDTLRGDLSQNARFISFGDAHSYDEVGESGTVGASVVTQLGVVCDDQDVKDAMLSVRDNLYDNAGSASAYTRPIEDLYHYATLDHSATSMSQSSLEENFYFEFESAWDKYILRDGYDYENDTVVMIDGGDKPGFGHPNAEFDLYVYALGEPFLDQPQVPFEDDVRSERWHNTLSLSNSTAAAYDYDATDPTLNQPFGGASNPLTSTYPLGDYMPDGYRGNTTDYFGLQELIGGVRMIQPYTNTSSDPERHLFVYKDLILDYYVVERSVNGLIQFNWLNIFEEFTPEISGTNLSFNRTGTGKRYEISVLSTDQSITLEGGDSGVSASKQKTGSADLDVNYGSYRHYTSAEGVDIVFLHHWYEDADGTTIAEVSSGDDVGVFVDSNTYILLDTAGDGTSYGGYSTDGWSLFINSSHVGSNGASYIDNGTGNISLPFSPFSGILEASGDEGEPCVPDLQQTAMSEYVYGSCNVSDQRTSSRFNITFDANDCGGENVTNWDNDSVSCDYCTYDLAYSAGNWSNVTNSCGYRTLYTWDNSFSSCCNLTGISEDCYESDYSLLNGTYYQGNYSTNQTLSCDPGGLRNVPMSFPVFLVIAGIAMFFIIIGMAGEIPFFTMIGFFMIFVLGFVIQAGNLTLPSGQIETVNGSVTTIIKTYDAWDTGNYHVIGWFVMIAGIFATMFSAFATFGGGGD